VPHSWRRQCQQRLALFTIYFHTAIHSTEYDFIITVNACLGFVSSRIPQETFLVSGTGFCDVSDVTAITKHRQQRLDHQWRTAWRHLSLSVCLCLCHVSTIYDSCSHVSAPVDALLSWQHQQIMPTRTNIRRSTTVLTMHEPLTTNH